MSLVDNISQRHHALHVKPRTHRRHRRDVRQVQQVPARLDTRSILTAGLSGAGIGSAAGALSLLAKVKLPVLGRVTGILGLGRIAALGAGVGVAASVLPQVDRRSGVHAALTGASIGAAAGLVLPLLSPVVGAIAGAAIGLAAHALGGDDRTWDGGWAPVGCVPASYYGRNTGIVPAWMGGSVPMGTALAGAGMLPGAMGFGMPPLPAGVMSPYAGMASPYAGLVPVGSMPVVGGPAPASQAIVKPVRKRRRRPSTRRARPTAHRPRHVRAAHSPAAAVVRPLGNATPSAYLTPAMMGMLPYMAGPAMPGAGYAGLAPLPTGALPVGFATDLLPSDGIATAM